MIEILATDDDDRSKSNGPPFSFSLDHRKADDEIKESFRIEHLPRELWLTLYAWIKGSVELVAFIFFWCYLHILKLGSLSLLADEFFLLN